jgi:methionyl-tRNA formyltransferase
MSPRVFLIGDGPTALSALRSLTASCHVGGVIRTGCFPSSDPAEELAKERHIPIYAISSLADLQRLLIEHDPICTAISSFNRMIPPRILKLCKFVNVHYSNLPRYRGRANVNWALINGEGAVGISIHTVGAGLDDGGLLYQELLPIRSDDTATSLYYRLNAIQERELGAAVLRALAGDTGAVQNESHATYCCARTPDDGEIDWRLTTIAIDRFIRALTPPFPGAFTYLAGQKLRVVRATPRERAPHYEGRIPGRVIGLSRPDGWVDVLTGDGILRIHELAMDPGPGGVATTFISSTRMSLGLSKLDLLRRVETLETRLLALEALARRSGPPGVASTQPHAHEG